MWGSKGCPFPQPQATLAETRDPDVQAEPEPASRGPMAATLLWGPPGICLSEGQPCPQGARPACPSPYRLSWEGEGARLPELLLLQKREKPRASPAPPWPVARFLPPHQHLP